MHISTNTVAYKFTYNTVTVLLAMCLYRIAKITETFSVNCLFNTFI